MVGVDNKINPYVLDKSPLTSRVYTCAAMVLFLSALQYSTAQVSRTSNSGHASLVADSNPAILPARRSGSLNGNRFFRSDELQPLTPRGLTPYPSASVSHYSGTLSDPGCPGCIFATGGIMYGRFGTATGVIGATGYSVLKYERDKWWAIYEGVSFHFNDELGYAHNFDKFGHFFGTYAWSLGIARMYEWSGMKPKTAALVGAAFGWGIQFAVEIYDGYIPRFGFDRLDIAANTLGAGWFYAQQRVQTLRNWHVRLGYYPETIILDDGSDYTVPIDKFLADDYANQSYWIAVKLHNYLPKKSKKYWPAFLMPSVGVALDRWIPSSSKHPNGSRDYPGHKAYYLSVDIDWSQIIPQKYALARMFSDGLNLFRLPFPALRLSPDMEFIPLYLGN